ncbi:MAG: hypothetical protein J1F09_08585, partial [Oscillospiraceae bacterium]|nr:hypothetical protein [Oscillospiraceae bacterium]
SFLPKNSLKYIKYSCVVFGQPAEKFAGVSASQSLRGIAFNSGTVWHTPFADKTFRYNNKEYAMAFYSILYSEMRAFHRKRKRGVYSH